VRVLVGYESRGGTTKRAAEAVAEAIRRAGHEAEVRPLSEVAGGDLEEKDALFVGSRVEGFILFGVGPAKAARRWLAAIPSLPGIRAGVFCTYAFHPRGTLDVLARGLEARGARVLARHAFRRRDPTAGAESFVDAVLAGGGA
jgi:uroporphyrinogen-III synthase